MSSEFGTKFMQRELSLLSGIPEFHYNTMYDKADDILSTEK